MQNIIFWALGAIVLPLLIGFGWVHWKNNSGRSKINWAPHPFSFAYF